MTNEELITTLKEITNKVIKITACIGKLVDCIDEQQKQINALYAAYKELTNGSVDDGK